MLLFAVLLLAQPALAYRPLLTEDPGVVEPGHTEMDFGVEHARSGGDTLDKLEIVAKGGFRGRVELDVILPYLLLDPGAGPAVGGPGDAGLGLKWRIRDGHGLLPILAVRGDWKSATGDEADGLGTGDYAFSALATAAWQPGPWRLLAMAGGVHAGEGIYGAAADLDLGGPWHAVAEIAGEPATASLGLYAHVHERVTLDGAYRRGLSDAAPDWTVTLGLTVR